MSFHGKLIGPNGQVYFCEHNHRTQTAAITCANSARTRQMAAMEWNRTAIRAAQAAALAKQRAEQRAAAQARKIAAQQAAAARRAADRAAAEQAKAAKRAAKLAAMPPQRAWKRMTPEERLLKIAEAELGFYGEIISPDAKAAYDTRAASHGAANAPMPPALPSTAVRSRGHAEDVPAYLRALDPSLSPYERAQARDQAAGDPQQWQKYVAALREQQAEREDARLKARTSGGRGVPARDDCATGPTVARAPAQSGSPPLLPAVSPKPDHDGADLRPSIVAGPVLSSVAVKAAQTRSPGNPTGSKPATGSPTGFGGDGLFVVGLDITPGVYRTPGPAGERHGSFALLRSTSTRDIEEFNFVRGPATITIGPGIKAVQVRGCQPWHRLGDNLDAVIAAASERRKAENCD